MLPLQGITVVTLEHAVAAPFATRQLADLGARVIKVERPKTGDFARGYDTRTQGMASHFVWINRSKESITLDLKSPQGRDVLQKLVSNADVLVQNLAPGAADRMGLSYAELHPNHPRLITCNISGYGANGPYRDRKAYDLLIQSEAGFLSVTGTPDDMVKAGISVADIAAGMYAYSTILAALIQRGQTGQGCNIDVSMLEALTEWMGYPMYYAHDGAPPPERAGAAHSTIFPYGPFPAGDGRDVMLGLQNEREWVQFCDHVLGDPSLAQDNRFKTNGNRAAHKSELSIIIRDCFAKLTADQVIEKLDTAGIANAHINDMAGLWSHPQLAARNRWRQVDTPAGPLAALLPPGGVGPEPRMDPIPDLGQHTDAILAELGYDDATISKFHASSVV